MKKFIFLTIHSIFFIFSYFLFFPSNVMIKSLFIGLISMCFFSGRTIGVNRFLYTFVFNGAIGVILVSSVQILTTLKLYLSSSLISII